MLLCRYDKYREVILRGRGDDYDDESIDLMPYFQPSVYSGYGDGEQGFFAVFGKVFKTVAEEDDTFDDPGSQEQKAIHQPVCLCLSVCLSVCLHDWISFCIHLVYLSSYV